MKTCIYCGKECNNATCLKGCKDKNVEMTSHLSSYNDNHMMGDDDFIYFLWDVLNNVLFQDVLIGQATLDIIKEQMIM